MDDDMRTKAPGVDATSGSESPERDPDYGN